MPLMPHAFPEREFSLADRIVPTAPRRSLLPSQEPMNVPRQPQDRRVVLEPKMRRSPDNEGLSASPDNAQRFEPLPPAKTARTPRRPLTYQDFPELNDGNAPANSAPPNRTSSKPRGFFDWMAGKDRSSKASSPAKSVAFQQRPRSEKLASEQGHRNGSLLSAGRVQGEGQGSDASTTRQNSEESIEIPKFFKKPVS